MKVWRAVLPVLCLCLHCGIVVNAEDVVYSNEVEVLSVGDNTEEFKDYVYVYHSGIGALLFL